MMSNKKKKKHMSLIDRWVEAAGGKDKAIALMVSTEKNTIWEQETTIFHIDSTPLVPIPLTGIKPTTQKGENMITFQELVLEGSKEPKDLYDWIGGLALNSDIDSQIGLPKHIYDEYLTILTMTEDMDSANRILEEYFEALKAKQLQKGKKEKTNNE